MKLKGVQQILLMSKFALYGLFLQCFLASFILARNGNAQKSSLEDIHLTLNVQENSLQEVFEKIESKTDFYFAYKKDLINQRTKLNFSVRDESLADVLRVISKNTNLRFKRINNNIYIAKKNIFENAVAEVLPEIEEIVQIKVSGKVTSAEDGELLPGVSILVKGTSEGTTTDFEGKFVLEASENSVLQFSYIGFETQEVTLGAQTQLNVALKPDAEQLEEVIVVGYGTQKKSDLTGAVVRADIESFRESPNVNIAQSLQGTVPGLNVGQVDAAGESPSISVRGRTTISGDQNVLVVVDGIIYTGSINDLNPNDIASIDVLKDPSSMAIYGAQSANGVILVTTKGGSKKKSKPVFNYAGSYTTQSPTNTLTAMNREEFLAKSFDVDWEQAYLPPEYTQLNPDISYLDIVGDPELRDGYDKGYDYDWYDEGTQTGFIANHNLSMQGRGENTSYYISGGYTNQKGIILNDRFKRITTRINIETDILDWLTVGAQTFGSFSDYSGDSPNLSTLAKMTPLVRPYDESGELILNPNGSNLPNPFINSAADDFDQRNSLFGNFYLDVDIPFVKGLNYRLNFGNNYSWDRRYNSNVYDNGATGGAFKTNRNWYDWTLDHIVTYKKVFAEKHKFDVTLVAGQRDRNFEETTARGSSYNSLKLSYNDLSLATNQFIESDAWDESYLYQMARLNYEFNYKYLFTATVRRDGFSGFAKNNKTAIFPSVGLGWVLSEESFLQNDWLTNLKLRASYGSNGNLVNRYQSLARVNSYAAYVFNDGGNTLFGQEVSRLPNPNLSWETTTGFNFGLDFGFLNNRLSGSMEFYKSKTTDLIYDVNLPNITGFTQITTNVGEIDNNGFEIMLNGKIIQSGDFTWTANFNLSANNNKIVSLIGLDADGDGQEDDLPGSGLFIGESINAIYDYESAGMIQLGDEEVPNGFFEGTHRIVDQDGNDFIDPNDRTIVGREEPAYRLGFLNEFNYKSFTLRVFINSVQGGKDGYRARNMLDGYGSGDNIRRNNMWNEYDYWTPANPNSRYRRLDQEPAFDYIYYGDRSFVRLQDITLAYTLLPSMADKIGLQNAKIFLSGKNLFTWTDWQGWDPETSSGFEQNGRPVLRGISAGLDISF